MPREGETPLARLAQAITHGDGLSLGTASLRADGVTAVIPIVATRGPLRTYVLAAELVDPVSAMDLGRLDRLRVRNDSGRCVFLPPGTLFEGRETPSRGTTAGVLLDPGSEVDVEVKCVHPSQAVSSGAMLRLVRQTAPDAVRQALLSRDQGLVWARVEEMVAPAGRSAGSGDLVAVSSAVDRVPLGGSEHSPGLSFNPDQCGILMLDAQGVVAVELANSPESWQSISSAVSNVEVPRTQRARRSPLAMVLDSDKARRTATDFLGELGRRDCRRVTRNGWTAVDGSSTYTVLDGEVVHLLAYRRDLFLQSPSSGASDATPGVATRTHVGATHLLASPGSPAAGDGDVGVAEAAAVDVEDVSEPVEPRARPIRRKVLTSGWDAATFETLERFARKEFGGDRSAAMRSLVRQGLRHRGYFGPRPAPTVGPPVTAPALDDDTPGVESGRAMIETRIHDFERIALTDSYADWLRDRARLELERMGAILPDEVLREAARSALGRLPTVEAVPETTEPAEVEVPPPALDVRPLLRRAFSASAGGQFSEALHLFDDVLDAEPDNRTALLGRAVALRRSGKAPEALAALDLVLRLEPNNAAALLNRGRVLQERGDYRGALDTFDRLAAVAPNDWDVWMARGEVLARMGQDREALGAYSEALRRNPDDESIQVRIRTLERARPAPAPATLSAASLPRDVQEGQSYLVKESRPDLSYRILRTLAGRNVPCLVITRDSSERKREDPALGGVRILELSYAPGEAHVNPDSLAVLTRSIERFLQEHHGRGVVLLDTLRPLILDNGFRETVLFVERVHELILQSPAIFLISVAPGDLAEREVALLERNLRVLV